MNLKGINPNGLKMDKLLTGIQLHERSKDDLLDYIDKLHGILKDYQLVFDMAEARNKKFND